MQAFLNFALNEQVNVIQNDVLWFISFIMFSTYYENQIFYKNLKNNKELNIFYKQIGNNQIFYNSTTKTFSIKNL